MNCKIAYEKWPINKNLRLDDSIGIEIFKKKYRELST